MPLPKSPALYFCSFTGFTLSLSIKISWAGPSKSSNCPAFMAHKKAQIISPININDMGINKNNISITVISLNYCGIEAKFGDGYLLAKKRKGKG